MTDPFRIPNNNKDEKVSTDPRKWYRLNMAADLQREIKYHFTALNEFIIP